MNIILLTSLILSLFSSIPTLSPVVTAQSSSSSCSQPLAPASSSPNDPYWYQDILHQGTGGNGQGDYKVFRNVKDFGAIGDGIHDDTLAINSAISAGNRCLPTSPTPCQSSTLSPAVIYFPQGTYLLSSPINSAYYDTLLGDAKHWNDNLNGGNGNGNVTGGGVVLKAMSNFTGLAIIDANPYGPDGQGWYIPQNNFFRSVRNFVIDLTETPPEANSTGIHWRVAQSTSINFVTINMSTQPGNNHRGIFIEDGSGGFMSDVTTNGGKYGMQLGNQQFTIRSFRSNGATLASIYAFWNWGFTFQNTTLIDSPIGFLLSTGGNSQSTQAVGGEYLLDSTVRDVGIFVATSTDQVEELAGSIVIDNASLDNVTTAVGVVDLDVSSGLVTSSSGTPGIIAKTTTFQGPGIDKTGKIDLWIQGNVYSGDDGTTKNYTREDFSTAGYVKPKGLIVGGGDEKGKVVGRSRMQFEDYSVEQFVSVKSAGAKGDGVTDDTVAINNVISQNSGCKIIFFDAGTYLVTDTIQIPAGTIIYSEYFSVILGSGSNFSDGSSLRPVVKVGNSGETSSNPTQLVGLMFSTVSGSSGAVIVEWNVASDGGDDDADGETLSQSGMWDCQFRIGGAMGTKLDVGSCPAGSGMQHGTDCQAAALAFHITNGAAGYFENIWVWAADHDLEDPGQGQIDVYSARGVLIESTKPTWFVGSASEHHTLYQYNLASASNVYMGLIQSESAYYQPAPAVPAPFSANKDLHDPDFPDGLQSGWGLSISKSHDIVIGGAGLYSFFSNYAKDCEQTFDCQPQIANIDSDSSNVRIYSLATVAVTSQLSVDGKGVIQQADNRDGFQSLATFWGSKDSTAAGGSSSSDASQSSLLSLPALGLTMGLALLIGAYV